MLYANRTEAGRLLALHLARLRLRNPVVLALPRGGLPVAEEVARALHAPLDVVVVRKVGAPGNPEYGIGAVAEDGKFWLNEGVIDYLGINREEVDATLKRETEEVRRRVARFRGKRSMVRIQGRQVLLVDDGLATGVTASVAVRYLRELGAREVIIATPVGAAETVSRLEKEADEVICLRQPPDFTSVGSWYEDFTQVEDEDVIEILARNPITPGRPALHEIRISVPESRVSLPGTLVLPASCSGIVLFAHGSGSSRLSPRNAYVATELNRAGLGTLLFDLLSPEEAEDRDKVFDIPLLASRLLLATRWLREREDARSLPIGFFGASTGAGAALWAAADLRDEVAAIVSRGGRPDLAIPRLDAVTAPTLLIVGGDDEPVISMNEEARAYLRAPAELRIVPGATHLFEEPGALERVAKAAADWFGRHFYARSKSSTSAAGPPTAA